MHPLDRRSRLALAGASLCCYAAAAASMPQGAHGQSIAGVLVAPTHMTSEPLPTRPPLVLPRRDPFAGHDDEASADPSAAPATMPAVPLPAIRIGSLPANAGANRAIPLVPGEPGERAATVVHAIGLGSRPVALVQMAGADRLVTVGERVDGRRIVAIDAGGIRLEDGSRLELAAGGVSAMHEASPEPAAPSPSPSATPSLPAPSATPSAEAMK